MPMFFRRFILKHNGIIFGDGNRAFNPGDNLVTDIRGKIIVIQSQRLSVLLGKNSNYSAVRAAGNTGKSGGSVAHITEERTGTEVNVALNPLGVPIGAAGQGKIAESQKVAGHGGRADKIFIAGKSLSAGGHHAPGGGPGVGKIESVSGGGRDDIEIRPADAGEQTLGRAGLTV